MNNKEIWNILGIDETKDKNEIKNAYRKKLVSCNPEDDQEGFMQLREAFDIANEFADKKEVVYLDSPVLNFWQQLEGVYISINKRCDINCWKEILTSTYYTDFDTAIEARDLFITFIMDNYKFPTEIWSYFEEIFSFTNDPQALFDNYNESFVTFFLDKLENGEFFKFEHFIGDEFASYDDFMNEYYNITSIVKNMRFDDFCDAIKKINEFKIYHPYLDVEVLQYNFITGNFDNCKIIVDRLLDKNYDDVFVNYYIADYLWTQEKDEKAILIANKILEDAPEHYNISLMLVEYKFYKNEPKEAKEELLDIFEKYGNSPKGQTILKEINNVLIDIYEKEIEDNYKIETVIELCWCYIQNENYDACLSHVDKLELSDGNNYFDYINLITRTYFFMEENKKTIIYAQKWIELIDKLDRTDESKKNMQRLRRLPYGHYILGACKTELALTDPKYAVLFTQAIKHIEKALELEINSKEKILYLERLSFIYLKQGNFETCVELASEAIEIDRQYLPAYLNRQEAFYELKFAAGVIDDYYYIMQIFPKAPQVHVLAIKVYFYCEEFEKALDIYENALNHEIESDELTFYMLRSKWCLIENKKEEKALIGRLKLFADELLEKDETDILSKADVFRELYSVYKYMNILNLAMDSIDTAIELDSSNVVYKFDKAGLYALNKKNVNKAIEIYDEIIFENNNLTAILLKSELLRTLRKSKLAYDLCMEALKYYPENFDLNNEVLKIFKDYDKINNSIAVYSKSKYFKAAFKSSKRLVELYPERYTYVELGYLYEKIDDYQSAVLNYEKARECEPSSYISYINLGDVYRRIDDYENSVLNLEIALEMLGDEANDWIFRTLASSYEEINNFKKALHFYEKAYELSDDFWDIIDCAKILYLMKKYKQAIKKLDVVIENGSPSNKLSAYKLLAKSCIFLEQYDDAIKAYSEITNIEIESKEIFVMEYIDLGRVYFNITKKYEEALKLYKKFLPIKNAIGKILNPKIKIDDVLFINIASEAIRCYRKLGDFDNASLLFKYTVERFSFLESFIEEGDVEEKKFAYEICLFYAFAGENELAKKYLNIMYDYKVSGLSDEIFDCDYHYCKSFIHYNDGDIDLAIEEMKIAFGDKNTNLKSALALKSFENEKRE